MTNIPEAKIGVVAVSRDCFTESLSVSRREALMQAVHTKFQKFYYKKTILGENKNTFR